MKTVLVRKKKRHSIVPIRVELPCQKFVFKFKLATTCKRCSHEGVISGSFRFSVRSGK